MPVCKVEERDWEGFSSSGKELSEIKEPLVLKGFPGRWKCRAWTPAFLHAQYGHVEVEIKLEKKKEGPPSWEKDCEYCVQPLREFCNWLEDQGTSDTGQLSEFPREYWSGYMDYKYFPQIFDDGDPAYEAVQWKDLGINAESVESVLWMGSDGACTPLHYDTYGCNAILEIYGTKEWILFPPEASVYLKPSRIPFEESSVYSQVGVSSIAEVELNPTKFCGNCFHALLKAGDLLYVPHGWWHQVKCVSTAISINVWTKHNDDYRECLHESLTRFLIMSSNSYKSSPSVKSLASRVKGGDETGPTPVEPRCEWLNPNEKMWSIEEALASINMSLDQLKQQQRLEPGGLKTSVSIHQIVQAICHPRVVATIGDVLTEDENPNHKS